MQEIEAIRFACPFCDKQLCVAANLAGKRVRCPNKACARSFAVPLDAPPAELGEEIRTYGPDRGFVAGTLIISVVFLAFGMGAMAFTALSIYSGYKELEYIVTGVLVGGLFGLVGLGGLLDLILKSYLRLILYRNGLTSIGFRRQCSVRYCDVLLVTRSVKGLATMAVNLTVRDGSDFRLAGLAELDEAAREIATLAGGFDMLKRAT